MKHLLAALLVLSSCGARKERLPKDFAGCYQEPKFEKVQTVKVENALLTAFSTREGGELVDCLPSIYPHSYMPLPLYSVRLENLKAGDVINASVESEFTNDVENDEANFMIVAFFALGPSPSYYLADEVGDRNGYNITRAMHHGTFNKSVTYTVTRDMPEAYLTVQAYAADGSTLEPEFLKVEQGYGRLSGMIFRPEPIPSGEL